MAYEDRDNEIKDVTATLQLIRKKAEAYNDPRNSEVVEDDYISEEEYLDALNKVKNKKPPTILSDDDQSSLPELSVNNED